MNKRFLKGSFINHEPVFFSLFDNCLPLHFWWIKTFLKATCVNHATHYLHPLHYTLSYAIQPCTPAVFLSYVCAHACRCLCICECVRIRVCVLACSCVDMCARSHMSLCVPSALNLVVVSAIVWTLSAASGQTPDGSEIRASYKVLVILAIV